MDQVLKFRNEIYGFLALWILFFHIECQVGMVFHIPFLTHFIQIGNFAVDVFLFLSGFCLCLSLKRDDNTKRFYIKRFKRVVITYLIIAIPFFIWKSIEEVSTNRFANFIYDLSGLSFWISGCQNAWFVEAILLFYIITPILFRIIRYNIAVSIVTLFIIYALNITAFLFIPIYHHSTIAWTRLPIFFIGIIMAFYWPHIEISNRKKISAWVFVLCLVFLFFIPGHLGGFLYWQLYALMVLPFLLIISELFSHVPQTTLKYFFKVGLVSLEIYLVHIMTLHIFTFYGMNKQIGQWMYLLLPAISLPISLIVPHITSYIINIINKKSIPNS